MSLQSHSLTFLDLWAPELHVTIRWLLHHGQIFTNFLLNILLLIIKVFNSMKPELHHMFWAMVTMVKQKTIASSSVLTFLDLFNQWLYYYYLFSAILIFLCHNLVSSEVNYLLKKYVHIYIYRHKSIWILTKNTTDISEASRHSHNSGHANISVWAHPLSSRGQHSHNIFGMFFHQLERNEPINNIKQARPHHLIYTFVQLTLELPEVL